MQDPFPGSSEIIREAFRIHQAPEAALSALLASLSPATLKQYARPLQSWWYFCREHRYSLYTPGPSEVLEFLAQEMRNIGTYSLNTTRSAVSLLTRNSIGADSLMKRFCKGVSVLKPQRPRYDFIWDPAPIIAELRKLFPYESLPMDKLVKKLVLLLALASGQRCQTIAAVRVSQISMSIDRVVIRVPDRLKTSALGRAQPTFSFSRFSDRKDFCIMGLLEHYK